MSFLVITQLSAAAFIACAAAASATAIVTAQAQVDPSTGLRVRAERFHARLVAALAKDDRTTVATLFQYPLKVRVLGLDSRLVSVKDQTAMIEMHSLFFGPSFRCDIAARTPLGTTALSMADGRLIAQQVGAGFKITRMTVSLESLRPPKPSIEVRSLLNGRRQYAGRLGHAETDAYLVSARAGARLSVRLERFPGKALSISVHNQRTKEAVRGAATEYARVWSARIPVDGQYRVEIRRRVDYCEPAVTYLVTLSVH